MKILDGAKNLIEVDGRVYEAKINKKSCTGCAFISTDYKCLVVTAPCYAAIRPDGKYVIFVESENQK